jgi:predicted permease
VPEEEREFYLGDLRESGRRRWLREVAGAAGLRIAAGRRNVRSTPSGIRAPWIGHAVADLRLGVRQLLRTPGTTFAAFLALSIGIGLSGMMFSLMRGGLLPTLPVMNGERAVRIRHQDFSSTPAEVFVHWIERQGSFEGLGVSTSHAVSLIIDGVGGEPVSGAAIDPGTLPLLSIEPIMGRGFVSADAVPGAPKVALIGYDVWQSRLGGDPDALGRTIRMNGEPATVIGVMPEGFGFPFQEQVWTPLGVQAFDVQDRSDVLSVFGILREGVSNADAAAELNSLAEQRPRAASDPAPVPVEVKGYTNIVNPSRVTYVLAGLMVVIAVLVLLVACANVTNVLLARASVRTREVAVRAALGASRLRIAMHFWTEATVLAVAGATGGAGMAILGVALVRDAAMVPGMPYWFDLRVDAPVLGFIAASAALAAMAAGVLPAVHAARSGDHELLKDASRGTSSRHLGRLMGRLVGVQLAVSFVLLVGSGLFIRSALNLKDYDFRFGPEGVYTANVRLPEATYRTVQDRVAFVEELEERLEAIPGASSAALTTDLPGIGHRRARVAVDGVHDPGAADLPTSGLARVTPHFFETFLAPLISGRGFDRGDRPGELPVAIVNAAFERLHLPNGAIGRRIGFPGGDGAPEWHTVVGVAPDFLAPGIDPEHPLEVVYLPLAQDPPVAMSLSMRADGPPAALAAPLRQVVADVDPDVAVYFMRSLEEAIVAANASFIWLGALFVVAGGLALFLAAVGLYGVMAFWVSQRRREIGVRMAVGGGGGEVVGFVVRQGMARMAFGILAGLLLSVPLAWALRGALLDVSPFDPSVFGTVLGVLLSAGLLGCVFPAVQATRVDPATVLSSD